MDNINELKAKAALTTEGANNFDLDFLLEKETGETAASFPGPSVLQVSLNVPTSWRDQEQEVRLVHQR